MSDYLIECATKEEWAARAFAAEALNAELLEALSMYADTCNATETKPCGYEGNMCCMTARAAITKAERTDD